MKYNALVPELSVTNFEESLAFYTKVLGFTVEYKRNENKFAYLSLGEAQLMIEECNGNWSVGALERPFGRGINFEISVESIGPMIATLKENGHALFKEPQENWYRQDDKLTGNKEFLIQDPDGYLLRFSEDLGTKPA